MHSGKTSLKATRRPKDPRELKIIKLLLKRRKERPLNYILFLTTLVLKQMEDLNRLAHMVEFLSETLDNLIFLMNLAINSNNNNP